MPKPENIERFIGEWLRGEGYDNLVAYTRCATVSMVTAGSSVTTQVSSSDPRWAASLLGRDLGDNAAVLGSARAFALTPTRFLVLRLGGFKERVKQAEFDVDAAAVVVHHVDAIQAQGNTARYFIADLPDGRWVCDSMIMVKKDGTRAPFADAADGFLAALGDRAQPIPIPR